MPHRVATFFRSHTNSFELPTELKKSSRRSSNSKTSRPALSDRSPSSSGSSLTSEERGGSVKMPEGALKRLSLTGLHSPKHSSAKVPQLSSFDILIESPPLIFYGSTVASTGALLSGQLRINVHEDLMAVNAFKMVLASELVRKKPFHGHCVDCQNKTTEFNVWNFLQGPATLRRGEHTFPFSFLLPGNLPASMKGSLAAISYVLRATVTPKTGEPLKLSQVLDIKRAIFPSDQPRNSIRIFPPTNLTANCQLPAVIHPIGENKLTLRMDGILKRNPDSKTQAQWKLKRMTWRLDETQRTISPGCAKHVAKLGPNAEETKKAIAHQDVRTIGTDDIKSGWKADYSSPDGSIELEFPFGVRSNAKPICDLKSEDGTEVSHVLIVEMIVAEEICPMKKPRQVTPTGAARVLRMHFNVILTERSGMGISWDEEQPPLYENVPASPPAYATGHMELYDGEPIPDYEDLPPLDAIHANPPPAAQPIHSTTVENGESSRRRLSISDLELEGLIPSRTRPDEETPEEDIRDVAGAVIIESGR